MKRGFTLIEVLVAITIIGLISTIVFSSSKSLDSGRDLERNGALLVSVLNQARSLTLGSKGDDQYGVRFGAKSVILFKGASYSPTEEGNVTVDLGAKVSVTGIDLSGGSDVSFDRLTGKTSNVGTVRVSYDSNPNKYMVITIHGSGLSELN